MRCTTSLARIPSTKHRLFYFATRRRSRLGMTRELRSLEPRRVSSRASGALRAPLSARGPKARSHGTRDAERPSLLAKTSTKNIRSLAYGSFAVGLLALPATAPHRNHTAPPKPSARSLRSLLAPCGRSRLALHPPGAAPQPPPPRNRHRPATATAPQPPPPPHRSTRRRQADTSTARSYRAHDRHGRRRRGVPEPG